jgi:hypothetical protein
LEDAETLSFLSEKKTTKKKTNKNNNNMFPSPNNKETYQS